MRAQYGPVLVVIAAACGPARTLPATPVDPAEAKPAPVSPKSRPHKSVPETRGEKAWLITEQGIGPVHVGEPLPEALIVPELYDLRVYSDFQPIEGFWVDNSVVFAALSDGPLHRKMQREVGPLPEASTFAKEAAKEAKTSLIEMVYAEHAGPHTPEGVAVGTGYDEFRKIHPNARIGLFPTLFEEPTCMGADPGRKSVSFFFDKCDEKGVKSEAVVIRIVVR